jgi:hypothetical protein
MYLYVYRKKNILIEATCKSLTVRQERYFLPLDVLDESSEFGNFNFLTKYLVIFFL